MARLSAKVGLLHPLVGHDLRRRADRDDLAGVETHHALRKTHYGLHDVLDHADGNAVARADVRRQPRDVLVTEHHGAGLGTEGARNAVDQRRLSRAVRADEAEPLSRANIDADIVQGDEAAEALCERADLQQRRLRSAGRRHALLPLRLRRALRIRPMIPSGATTTNSTSITPSTSTFTSDEIVTVSSCCVAPNTIAPTTGPAQCAVPPISDIASTETE